jgi:hypothetical protein
MYDTVWQPRQYVEDPVFVLREDVTQVGAIENVLEGRKDLDPDGWSIFTGDESENNLSVFVVQGGQVRKLTGKRRRR